MSLDALKKKPGYVSLAQHFSASYGAAGLKHFRVAQRNLANSLAAYSLVCYIFQIKDRLVCELLFTLLRHAHSLLYHYPVQNFQYTKVQACSQTADKFLETSLRA
jgi:hypothetical protein